jgi:hypothetical protein
MNAACSKEWSRKFIRDNFTNVFIQSKFKKHLEDVLFDQEKSLLPATQPLVEVAIAKEAGLTEIANLDKLIRDLQRKRQEISIRIHNIKVERVQTKFVRTCPADNCRGFLSSQWKCGICSQWTCPECHELKGLHKDCDHTCDPNNVETAKLLAKDTKNCPKCHASIFKISGCSQMWCTQCHTAFNWNTGAIETHIHNPHYYEWQRKNGGLARAVGDVECGRELDHRTADAIIQLVRKKHSNLKLRPESEMIDRLSHIIRHTTHLIRYELPQYQTDYVRKNQDLRIKYLRNVISEQDFKNTIQKNDKRHRKNGEIAQVFQLMNTAITDIVFRIIDHLKTCEPNCYSLIMISEVDEIIKYCNEIFKDISYTYNSVQYAFNSTVEFIKVEKDKKGLI